MKITQNDNKVFTKGLDNIEAQGLATIKRFFERNPRELEGSIDWMVLETLRRVKEDLLSGDFIASVTSVNEKNGVVTLDAGDVGAEPTIDRKTAFNKDFGSEEGEVCEGNDPRLSDDRNPLEHSHEGYMTTSDIDKAIEDFLKKKGISFSTNEEELDVITITNKDLVIINGELLEETTNV